MNKINTLIFKINQEKNQKIKISRSKSNTQTYSIHSEEDQSTRTRKSTITSVSNLNDNAITSTFIKPRRSLNKISQKSIEQILLHTEPFTNTVPFSNHVLYSKGHPFIVEAMHSSDLKKTRSHSKMLQTIRHYTKYCYQHSDIHNNEKQITDIDTEKCPLEDILDHRFTKQI